MSIRLQISLVLLLSALILFFVLFFAAAVLWSIPTAKEGRGMPQLHQIMRELTALHREVLDGSSSERMSDKMEELEAPLLALEDDNLPKPFDPEELLLRTKALLRRAGWRS